MKIEEIKTELKKMVPEFAKKVAPVYELLGWEWSPRDTAPHIPSVDEIERTLYDLIEDLTEQFLGSGCGGLDAYYSQPNEQPGEYGLRFILSEVGFYSKEEK